MKVKIKEVLPLESICVASDTTLLSMDIIVEFENGSIANVEIQKIGYKFPGERAACYGADLLLRQYKRAKADRGEDRKFSYKDIKPVYTIIFYEKSPGEFKTKELSSQINSARLSFAGEDAMLKYLDIEPGAVSIMGLMNDKDHDVTLLIDEDVLRDEYLGCHPCVCTSSLKLRTADLIEKFLPATGHTYTTVHLVGED